MTLYANDPDVNVVYPITDGQGGTLDFAPVVRARGRGGNFEITTGQWQGGPGATRDLRIPLYGLTPGLWNLRLVVAGENDLDIGRVVLAGEPDVDAPTLPAPSGSGSSSLVVVSSGTLTLPSTATEGALYGYRLTVTTLVDGVSLAAGSYVFERVGAGWTYRTLATGTTLGSAPDPDPEPDANAYATAVATDSPSTFLRFEGGTTNTGSSSEVYTGTALTYATALGDGTQAADFNGTTSTLICADGGNQGVGGCTALTVEAIVSADGPGDIFFQFGCFRLDVAQNASDLVARTILTTGGDTTVTGTLPLGAGTTHHLAATWDGTTVRLYVDGASVGTPAAATGTTPNYASFPPSSGGPNSTKFNGRIDGLAVYRNKALTGARILAHAQAAGVA